MKKIIFMFTTVLFLSSVVSAQITVYSNALSSLDKFNEMKVLDNNSDGKTWHFSSSYAQYSYSSSNAGDDYLFTPGLQLKAGKNYELKFQVSAYNSSSSEKLKVKIGKGTTAEEQFIVLEDYPSISGSTFTTKTISFQVTENDTYYISFYAYTESNKWHLRVKEVSIVEIVPVPGSINDASIVAGKDNELKATLSWKNPHLDSEGGVLAQENLTKICVFRNNEEEPIYVQNNPTVGENVTWTDNNIPTVGFCSYRIVPYNNDLAGKPIKVSVFIGSGSNLPYTNTFSSITDFETCNVLDNNNDDKSWKHNANGYAEYSYSSSNAADDYLFLPALLLKPGKTYRLKFMISISGRYDTEKLMVKVGKGTLPSEQIINLMDFPSITNTSFEEKTIEFGTEIADEDTYYISFYAYSAKYMGNLRIKDVSVEELVNIPGKVSEAKVISADNKELKATLTWKNPELNSKGDVLLQSELTKIEIYRNDKAEFLYTIENPELGNYETWIDETITSNGSFTYRIIPFNGLHAGEETVLSTWVGGGLTLPYVNNFSQEEFDLLTIIDANADNKTWSLGENIAQYKSYSSPDDWLITPILNLTGGKTYVIKIQDRNDAGRLFKDQLLEVTIGDTPSVEGQNIKVAEVNLTAAGLFVEKTFIHTLETSGDYHLGLRLFNNYTNSSDGEYIYLRSISVNEFVPVLLNASTGGNNVTVAWSAPSYDGATFNVYRNDVKIAEGLTETNFTDLNLSSGNYCYAVSISYDTDKESEKSNVLCETISITSVDNIDSGNIYLLEGQDYVQIESSEKISNIQVFGMDGRILLTMKDENKIPISTWSKGIYIIKIGTYKGEKVLKFTR